MFLMLPDTVNGRIVAMKNSKLIRSLSTLLSLTMVLGLSLAPTISVRADEEQPELPEQAVEAEGQILEGTTEPSDNDALFADYLHRRMYGSVSAEAMMAGVTDAADSLTAVERAVYDAMIPQVIRVADGEETSTVFAASLTGPGLQDSYTAEDLGVSALIEDGNMTDEAYNAMSELYDLSKVIYALKADLPYAFYWYGNSYSYTSVSYRTDGSTIWFNPSNITISLRPADDYKAGEYLTDSTKTSAAKKVVEKAHAIVEANDSLDDYGKLTAYKNAVCGLTEYNYAAAGGQYQYYYGDPWQLVYVFDEDPDTNVVCEGYSKAFQYLCDLTDFSDPTCGAISVVGGMYEVKAIWRI